MKLSPTCYSHVAVQRALIRMIDHLAYFKFVLSLVPHEFTKNCIKLVDAPYHTPMFLRQRTAISYDHPKARQLSPTDPRVTFLRPGHGRRLSNGVDSSIQK